MSIFDKKYNPLKEDKFTIGEFLDFAESKGWNRDSARRDVLTMLAYGNVTGGYHAALRNVMRIMSEETE